jgi:hypothetical protein
LIGWVKLVNYKALELKVAKFNTNMQVKLVEELKEVFKKNKNTIEKLLMF